MNNGVSPFRVDGKVSLVVGGASGIGQAAAHALAESGSSVVIGDVNLTAAQECAEQITSHGLNAMAVELDIRNQNSIDRALDQIRSQHPTLDILLTTPAVNVRKRLLTYTEDELDRVVDINLKGSFRITRAVAKLMAGSGGGSIILTSSIRSVTVEPGQGIYAATKASLVQLARTFAVELAPNNIRVNAIAPGVVDTPLTAPIKRDAAWYAAYANRSALKRWAKPDELAWPIVFLASPASSFITGTVLFVDG